MATATIRITAEQYEAAKKIIQSWFPGEKNKALRKLLRDQLEEQVDRLQGVEKDFLFPPTVNLGYGVFFLNGTGDERTRNFNDAVNRALGLIR